VWEGQVCGCGQDLDGAGGDPAVAAVEFAGGDWGLRPGQGVERGEQARLVLLAGEYEPGAAFVQVVRVRTLRVESIGSDDRVGQIDSGRGEGVQQRGELGDVGSTTRRGARLLWGSFSAWSPPEPAVRVSP